MLMQIGFSMFPVENIVETACPRTDPKDLRLLHMLIVNDHGQQWQPNDHFRLSNNNKIYFICGGWSGDKEEFLTCNKETQRPIINLRQLCNHSFMNFS
jgi:tRNA G37 N-methylase TrmD